MSNANRYRKFDAKQLNIVTQHLCHFVNSVDVLATQTPMKELHIECQLVFYFHAQHES